MQRSGSRTAEIKSRSGLQHFSGKDEQVSLMALRSVENGRKTLTIIRAGIRGIVLAACSWLVSVSVEVRFISLCWYVIGQGMGPLSDGKRVFACSFWDANRARGRV